MEAVLRFRLLPIQDNKRKRRLEDLFNKVDLEMMRQECGIPSNTKFNKVILAIYYSKDREKILAKVSTETKQSFSEVFNSLWN